MNKKKAKLKITLKSDACIGSGYSYAGIIDSDVCYTENGIPYIPARRIKGCLKEAAKLIGEDICIFGKRGNNRMGSICIGNAYIEGYEEISSEIEALKNCGYDDILDAQKVLDTFTYIKAQTAIDEKASISKENSLRYTRVVKRFFNDNNELCFLANIEFDCDYKIIENTAKALRHIGMNRKRGLGNVKCNIIYVKEYINNEIKDFGTDESTVVLEYVIKNTSPLILSGKRDDMSENFISGKSVIGALGAVYAAEGRDTEDEHFYNLFINGKVKYSNLYITDKDYKKCVPAPLFINRLKKTKKIVNILKNYSQNGDDYNPNGGNLPKKLKGKYIAIEDNKISVKEPLIDIVYHHSQENNYSHNSGRINSANGNLYTLEVIKENQYFYGTITGSKKYIDYIFELLEKNTLRFGKSKSAQYGECIAVKKHISDYNPRIEIKKGEKIIVYFKSGAIFQSKDTVRSKEIKKITADYLGLKYKENDTNYMFLQTETITGYNILWNLKKPSFSSIAAGSAIIYDIIEDCTVESEYIGIKNMEGFGEIKIYKFDELSDIYDEPKNYSEKIKPDKCLNLIEKILFKDFEDAMKEGSMLTDKIDISASTVGRVTLMLDESINNYKDNYKKSFEDFKTRIDSIKRKEEKRKIGVFLTAYLCEDEEFSIVKNADLKALKIDINKIIGNSGSSSRNIYNRITEIGIENAEEKIESLWSKYLKNILIYQKYAKKEG